MLPHLDWDGSGRWIEPFVGGASVVLAKSPLRAVLTDSNPHLIAFYEAVGSGAISEASVRWHLEREGRVFARDGREHYLRVRTRFNAYPTPADLLTLNHACFNGLMRFNKAGGFNTPFCLDPDRFTPKLVASIAERVGRLSEQLDEHDWQFAHADWRDTLALAQPGDFVYLDPPYFGLHAGYHNAWTESDARALASAVQALPCAWALSDWAADSHGNTNQLLQELYGGRTQVELSHRYLVGAATASRGKMIEALVLSGEATDDYRR